MQFITRTAGVLILMCGLLFTTSYTHAGSDMNNGAVILLYHHVASDTPRSTSVSPEEFTEHLDYIQANYIVLPLEEIVTAAKQQSALPDNVVAITFDDGYRNLYHNAHPLLKRYRFPYTVFINPDTIDNQANQLTWAQVTRMQKEGASFANHTLDHLHLLEKKPGENKKQWLERVWQNIEAAETKIELHTGVSLKYLAYPFGEYNRELANKVIEQGYTGFGQHSGPIGPYSDFAALPRFPAAGSYAKLSTLKTKLASFPLPVDEVSMLNPELSSPVLTEPVTITLDAVAAQQVQLNQTACYFQGKTLPVDVREHRFHFTLGDELPIGRSRVNCTAPSKRWSGRYVWFSLPFFRPDNNGRFPD